MEYAFAAAAAANNIELALSIGSRSVVAWACKSWYLPLFWILFSFLTSIAAGCSYIIIRNKDRATTRGPQEEARGREAEIDLGKIDALKQPRTRTESAPLIGILLQILASALAFVHIVLGTLILASLIFVGFHDTLRILARLISSALVCRAIVMHRLIYIKTKMEADK